MQKRTEKFLGSVKRKCENKIKNLAKRPFLALLVVGYLHFKI